MMTCRSNDGHSPATGGFPAARGAAPPGGGPRRSAEHHGRPRAQGLLAGCALAVAAVVLAPVPARATPDPPPSALEARAHAVAKQALAAYRRGAYAQSIRQYEEAYRLRAEPRYLYAIGMSYQKLGRPKRALHYLERFLRGSKRPAAAALRKRVAERIREIRRRTSLVILDVAPPGARVRVDGQPVGASLLGGRLRLANGWHRVTAALAGHRTTRKRFEVIPGRPNRVVVRLSPRRSGVRAALASRLGSGNGGVPGSGQTSRGSGLRVAGWTTLAVAGASVVTAVVLGGLALQAKKSVDGAAQDTPWEPGLARDYANLGHYRTGAWVATGIGAALGITGAVLLGVDALRRERRKRRVWLRPEVGPGEVSLRFGVRF